MCVFLLVIIIHVTMENQGLILITQTVKIISPYKNVFFYILFTDVTVFDYEHEFTSAS